MPPSAPRRPRRLEMRAPIDEQHLDALVVALDADGALAQIAGSR